MRKLNVTVTSVQFFKSGLGRKATTIFTGRIVKDDPSRDVVRPVGFRLISEPVIDIRDDGRTVETFGTIFNVVR